ncbi:MAG: hypothetical protein AB9869_13745 [Verrucomicrobiia bacterium]
MKSALRITVIAGVGLTLGVALPRAGDQKTSNDKGLPPATFDISGVWLASDPAIPEVYTQPLVRTAVINPTDPSGHRFTYVAQGINGDPTFMGLFPDATQLATQVGTIIRTGARTYEISSVQYFWKPPGPGTVFGTFDRGQVLYFFVHSGRIELLDANTMNTEGTLAFYSKVDRGAVDHPVFNSWGITELHNQDKDNDGFGDGLPDEGEVPFVCFPPTGAITKRLPLSQPCMPAQ